MSSVAKEVIKKQKIREYEGHLNSLDHFTPVPLFGGYVICS